MPEEKIQRSFKLVDSDVHTNKGKYGRYIDTAKRAPMSAARSAARIIFQKIDNVQKNPEWNKYSKFSHLKKIKIVLEETTRGSERRLFNFNIWREKMAKPIVKTINGNVVNVNFKYNAEVCGDKSASKH
jgi:hypothetical protein